METIILLLLFAAFGFGFYVRNKSASRAEFDSQRQYAALTRENAALSRDIDALRRQAAERQRKALERRQHFEMNDVSDTQNQLRFISQCDLQAVPPVNKEAARVLYVLDEWIKTNQPDWRFSFEVSMGAFIKTVNSPGDRQHQAAFSSYNSKRVDFLLIDRFGNPKLVIEYHGSGHNRSEDASERMEVKRLALERAHIPLLEIAERTSKADIVLAISKRLEFTVKSPASSQ